MTIAFSSPLLQVSLTPMQLPEGRASAAAPSAWGAALEEDDSGRQRLRITPGECSQLLVQVRNLRDRSLSIRLKLVGNFPADWVQPFSADEIVLPPQQSAQSAPVEQLNVNLTFNLTDWPPEAMRSGNSAQFFEHPTALKPQETLTIDYRAQLLIYGLETERDRSISGQESLTESELIPESDRSREPEKLIGVVDFDLLVRPRSLYLDFLPTIYREVDFIGRLLKIFEQSFEPAVESWQVLWAYLDPHTAPSALLPFLAHWVGWPGQVPWDEVKQRQLIRRAIEIYRWRGTQRGLRLYLHLYTGLPENQILIEEAFTRSFELGQARLGSNTLLGRGRPFHFRVRLVCDTQVIDESLVRSIIEQEKPAFCSYEFTCERI
jgi:phage tail-like protein